MFHFILYLLRFIRWIAIYIAKGVQPTMPSIGIYSFSQTAEIQDFCISTLIILLQLILSQGVQIKIFKKFADHYFVCAAHQRIIMKEKKTGNVSCNLILTYIPTCLHAPPHHTAYIRRIAYSSFTNMRSVSFCSCILRP